MPVSNLTDTQREQLQALETHLADVRALVLEAIERRDFVAMDHGFNVYRALLDEQTALVTGEPVGEQSGAPGAEATCSVDIPAAESPEPVLLGAWEYFSLCPHCRRTGKPLSWSATGRQIRIEYTCLDCQRPWRVTGTEGVKV